MKRTNINLKEDQHQYLKDLAEREGKSFSEVLREIIEFERENREKELVNDPIYNVIGIGSGDGKLDAEDHDEVLYPKRPKKR